MPVQESARPRGFSNEESFGLFMEAVCALQLYEEEADRIESSPVALAQFAEEAVETLERCNRRFPDDLLPRYYLGIALTIQNQRNYAKLLRQGLYRDVIQSSTGSRFGQLHDQPWPLLDQALDCFDHHEDYARVPELRATAQFNRANVYARLGRVQDFTQTIEILTTLLDEKDHAKSIVSNTWLTTFRTWVDGRAAARERDEAKAFELGARILKSAAMALQATARQRTRPDTVALAVVAAAPTVNAMLDTLTSLRDRAGDEIRDSIARHDLLADALTKRGLVKYSYAVLTEPWNGAWLDGAVADFTEALQHKPNWIPARTYLAQTYQALGKADAAEQQFTSILGAQVPPAPAAVAIKA